MNTNPKLNMRMPIVLCRPTYYGGLTPREISYKAFKLWQRLEKEEKKKNEHIRFNK